MYIYMSVYVRIYIYMYVYIYIYKYIYIYVFVTRAGPDGRGTALLVIHRLRAPSFGSHEPPTPTFGG